MHHVSPWFNRTNKPTHSTRSTNSSLRLHSLLEQVANSTINWTQTRREVRYLVLVLPCNLTDSSTFLPFRLSLRHLVPHIYHLCDQHKWIYNEHCKSICADHISSGRYEQGRGEIPFERDDENHSMPTWVRSEIGCRNEGFSNKYYLLGLQWA